MVALNDYLRTCSMGIIFTLPDSLIDQKDFKAYSLVEIGEVDNQHLDRWMDKLVKGVDQEAVNIFLPLVFGSTGSDLLGLRLALHVRCTPSRFQQANIFIYGTESLYKIRRHEFACIFHTEGIDLIDYNFHSLKKCSDQKLQFLTLERIADELAKIHLEVPKHIYDNHSIANIWGMYRMLTIAQIDPSTIESLNTDRNQLHNIYFKWLLSKNAGAKVVNEEVVEVKKRFTERLSGLKILGKIDLK